MSHPPLIDWSDPGVRADPYPHFKRLRDREPVHFCRLGGEFPVWMITRYEDAVQVLRDPGFGVGEIEPEGGNRDQPESLSSSPRISHVVDVFSTMMPGRDGPDHARLRGYVSGPFSPGRVELLRPRVRAMVDELLREHVSGQSLDLIAALAQPLPVMVMADLLGLPKQDLERLMIWRHDASWIADRRLRKSPGQGYHDPGLMENLGRIFHSARALVRYFEQKIRERRAESGDDLLSCLIAASEGRDGSTDNEIVALCIVLFGAGQTTGDMIGNGMLALLRHPQQKALLLTEPHRIPQAVEEMLRFDPSIQIAFRTALRGRGARGLHHPPWPRSPRTHRRGEPRPGPLP